MLVPFFYLPFLFAFGAVAQPQFEVQTIDGDISIGYGLATGDVDGDKKADVLLADKKQFAWYRNGDWKKFVMAANLTEYDNVCIAARDIDGDGKVEVAVGAQWNPGETGDTAKSGAVFYLVRPQDPTQPWKAIKLYHEPTIHRMQWYQSSEGKHYLIVAPLHGIGNHGGAGAGVNILVFEYTPDVNAEWPAYKLASDMHLTHNFAGSESQGNNKRGFYLAGKEGVSFVHESFFTKPGSLIKLPGMDSAAGEIAIGKTSSKGNFIATIEPMHGQRVVVYQNGKETKRAVIDSSLREGHAIATADFLSVGTEQVVAGWRMPNKDSLMGVKLYFKRSKGSGWESYWIDKNGMACEDIKIADLDLDGKPDIIASGRATHNLKIYWNRSGE